MRQPADARPGEVRVHAAQLGHLTDALHHLVRAAADDGARRHQPVPLGEVEEVADGRRRGALVEADVFFGGAGEDEAVGPRHEVALAEHEDAQEQRDARVEQRDLREVEPARLEEQHQHRHEQVRRGEKAIDVEEAQIARERGVLALEAHGNTST